MGVAVPEMYEHIPAVAEPEYLDSYHRAKKHIEELATFLRPIEKGAFLDYHHKMLAWSHTVRTFVACNTYVDLIYVCRRIWSAVSTSHSTNAS